MRRFILAFCVACSTEANNVPITSNACAEGGTIGPEGSLSQDSATPLDGDAASTGDTSTIVPATETCDRCPSGTMCHWDTGKCMAPAPAQCGLPDVPTVGTESPPHTVCMAGGRCASGFVCAADSWTVDASGRKPASGTCRPVCDPCNPSCAQGTHCMALGAGQRGGICVNRGLLGEGEACGLSALSVCGSNLVCTATCKRACVPATQRTAVPVGSVVDSADCLEGEVCTAMAGGAFLCQRGRAIAVGDRCIVGEPGCSAPASCAASSISSAAVAVGTCSTDCSVTPCPSGVGCFTLGAGKVCIRDGALPMRSRCAEARNCEAGLVCNVGGVCFPP